jgi:hypothetical protein
MGKQLIEELAFLNDKISLKNTNSQEVKGKSESLIYLSSRTETLENEKFKFEAFLVEKPVKLTTQFQFKVST